MIFRFPQIPSKNSAAMIKKTRVTDLIAARIDDFRQLHRVQASSLIVTVFGDAVLPRGGRLWLGSLIRLLEPLDLSERLIRTSVFRLVKDAWLSTETVGRRSDYTLTPSGRRRFEEASSHIYASQSPLWDRRWRLMLVVSDIEPRLREQLRRTLFWQGFGLVGGHCFIHPSANLADAIDVLKAEGLDEVLFALMPMVAADFHSSLAASDADLTSRAWDLDGLAQEYASFVAQYQPILEQVRSAPASGADDESVFLLRLLLIHDYRRLLLRDPQLPDVLLPVGWPGHQARSLCRELYRRLEKASGRHLERHLRLADGTVPSIDKSLPERFPEADPLLQAEPVPAKARAAKKR